MSNFSKPDSKLDTKNHKNNSVSSSDHRAGDTEKSEEVRVVDKRWWVRSNENSKEEVRSNKPTYIEELEKKIIDKDEEIKNILVRHQHITKEFENVRARMKREIKKDSEKETHGVLIAFLEIVDNLDRALGSSKNQSADKNLAQGIELVRRQCLKTLTTHGVHQMRTTGSVFDPNYHDAVSVTPTSEAEKDNIIIETLKTGYVIGDKILRPASVTVGKLQ